MSSGALRSRHPGNGRAVALAAVAPDHHIPSDNEAIGAVIAKSPADRREAGRDRHPQWSAGAPPASGEALDRQDEWLRRIRRGARRGRRSRERIRSGDLGVVPVVAGLVVIWTVFQVRNPIFLPARRAPTS